MYYLDNLHDYFASDNFADTYNIKYSYGSANTVRSRNLYCFEGIFQRISQQDYRLEITAPIVYKECIYPIFTLRPYVNLALESYYNKAYVLISGRINHAGNWLLVEHITKNKNILI